MRTKTTNLRRIAPPATSRTAKAFVCVALVSLFAGCTAPKTKSSRTTFGTLITDEGVKRFEIAIRTKQRPTKLSLDTNQQKTSSTRREIKQQERHLKRAIQNAIASSGYCKDGYILLGRFAGIEAHKIRGECRDSATDSDKRKFKNTIGVW